MSHTAQTLIGTFSRKFILGWILGLLFFSFGVGVPSAEASLTDGTIDDTFRYAWGENIGWVDFGSTTDTVHVTDSILTGSAYGENIGWIVLDPDGYGGVTNDGEGNLDGDAWGENIGWVDFSQVVIDGNGYFTGQAYGENIGWITFSTTTENKVRTDWRPASARVTLSGTLYSDEGVTQITSGKTIKVAVGTSTPSVYSTTTDSGAGTWSMTFLIGSVATGTPMVIYVDGETEKATTFTKASSTSNSITGLDLYQDTVILRHEGATTSTSTNITDLSFYDNDNDADINYNASSTADTFIVLGGKELHVWTGSKLTLSGSSTATGDVHIDTDAFLEAPEEFYIAGDYTNEGTFNNGAGAHWTARSAAEANSWSSVTYGNGLFVAVSDTGTNRVMTSPDGITWTARSAAEANQWQSVTYGNGLFVAVSLYGTNQVMTSPDGITWTARTAAEANLWHSVTYGNGLFVAVSLDGTNRVMTSPDGTTWTARAAAEANDWRSVTYGNGLFVAVSWAGTNRVMTSPDGITWTARSAAEANDWHSVTYGNGLFVAVSLYGTNSVMTSPDGITWTARTAAEANDWFSVTYGNGLFVAVSCGTAGFGCNPVVNQIMTSPDGITWTAHPTAEENTWRSVTYGNGLFVAVSIDGTNRVMTSHSLVNWNGTSAQTATGTMTGTSAFRDVAFSGDSTKTFADNASTTNFTIEAGATVGAPQELSIAGDYTNEGTFNNGAGAHWTARSAAEANWWSSVTYGNDLFVAVAQSGTNRVMTSPDGITWTARAASEANGWKSVTYGNGLFVAVANSGTNRVMTSPDGITWTARVAVEANNWQSVTYGNGLFVAVSYDGTNRVMTSPDGITWTARSAAAAYSWQSVIYGNGLFVAVCDDSGLGKCGALMTSPDGITWTTHSAAATRYWSSVTYGNGTFVAVATESNTITTSPDGITWTAYTSPVGEWTSVTYGNSLFVAVAWTGTNRVMTSPDGETWTARSAAETNAWRSVTYGNGLFVAVSQDGTNRVMTSSSLVNFNGTVSQTATGTLTGTSAFNNLTISNTSGMGSSSQSVILGAPASTTGVFTMLASTSLQLPANATSTFQDISLEGAAGQYVWLRSSLPGTQASFYVPGIQKLVTYVNVKDNNSCLATTTVTTGGYDASNNDCWVFSVDPIDVILANHTLGQVDNEFSFQNKTDKAFFAFNLAPEEEISVTDLVFTVSGIHGVTTSNFLNFRLYEDVNSDGLLDGGDTSIDAAGIFNINGQHGAITFSSDFIVSTSTDYLLIADTSSIDGGDALVISLPAIGITASVSTAITDTIDDIQHIRNIAGGGSSADRIGGAPPAGDGDVFGGGEDGGEGAGDIPDGENIAFDVDFFRPTATGADDNEWTNGSNALLSDGVYATAATTNLRQSYDTFGFSVPGGNTIEGIAVKLDTSGTTANGTIDVSISWDGGSSYTTAKATPTLAGSDVVYTVGGATDTWGRSWSTDNFSNANFILRVTAQPNSNTINLDALEVRIFHQAGGGGSGGGGGI